MSAGSVCILKAHRKWFSKYTGKALILLVGYFSIFYKQTFPPRGVLTRYIQLIEEAIRKGFRRALNHVCLLCTCVLANEILSESLLT